jgi:hypothetical protein
MTGAASSKIAASAPARPSIVCCIMLVAIADMNPSTRSLAYSPVWTTSRPESTAAVNAA